MDTALARVPADLLIVDLECVSAGDPPLLGWLLEEDVRYPVVVLCDELLKHDPEAAGEMVGKLWLRFWPKRFNWAEFVAELGGLLDEES